MTEWRADATLSTMLGASNLSLRERNRQATRDAVLDAAERLLRKSQVAEFSMRMLAVEAGVGFATPFNHFGSKNAIMQGLSTRLIDRMAARFREEEPLGDAIDRTLAMSRIAVACLLEQPDVYKAMIGSLGVVGADPSAVRLHSRALWSIPLGDLRGFAVDMHERARSMLPDQIAFAFRGCLSFWIAREIENGQLTAAIETSTAAVLLGFAGSSRRRSVLDRMTFRTTPDPGPVRTACQVEGTSSTASHPHRTARRGRPVRIEVALDQSVPLRKIDA